MFWGGWTRGNTGFYDPDSLPHEKNPIFPLLLLAPSFYDHGGRVARCES
ncbi:hypothetical protein FRUB_02649 [Fimbriiglobus ruber]|uniref:Uncharacterized protein n=1 Tax=Fimbriiglobus ruber TaxID=1908690 RepID=A0A225DNJ4_9BACT|nr:hypothetical protein FRUB_02649 [Fimbriiglobus ruber]